MRELARRAEISAAQVSRLEANAVDQPSVETLVAIAQALDRNPKPLLIVSGHVPDEEAVSWLRHVFREHAGAEYDPDVDSELVDDWSYGLRDRLEQARQLLAHEKPDRRSLRQLAADVFLTAETEETLWLGAWLVSHGASDPELEHLAGYWHLLPPTRRTKLLEYASEQVELSRAEKASGAGIQRGAR